MVNTIKTNSDNPDFLHLVKLLDEDLSRRNGDTNAFYAQFNKLDKIQHVIVAYVDEEPAACGAFKAFTNEAAEIKRMYVLPDHRRKGLGKLVLAALEQWIQDLKYSKAVLETGKQNPEALDLYKRSGYAIIPNYGQYAGVETSVCMEKSMVRQQAL